MQSFTFPPFSSEHLMKTFHTSTEPSKLTHSICCSNNTIRAWRLKLNYNFVDGFMLVYFHTATLLVRELSHCWPTALCVDHVSCVSFPEYFAISSIENPLWNFHMACFGLKWQSCQISERIFSESLQHLRGTYLKLSHLKLHRMLRLEMTVSI